MKMKTSIRIDNLKIFAFHGVLPEETVLGTYFIINANFQADLEKATQTDDLADTVNYAELNDIIRAEMAVPSKLLEHVGGRIISRIHESFPQITHISLKITKANPPMRGEMEGVSILLEKSFG